MARIVFKLNGVSEDEANDVRQLLDEHGFETYETSAGRWHISIAAIWLVHNDDKPRARALIDAYQAERSQRLQQEYADAKARGQAPSWLDRLREDPITFLAVLIGLSFVAGLSLIPFFRFIG
ncbi:MAG: DUF6164 family protein [Saccharospirillum sp.]